MKTTTTWDALWTDYIAAAKAGKDLTWRKARIREWHQARGWKVPSWAE